MDAPKSRADMLEEYLAQGELAKCMLNSVGFGGSETSLLESARVAMMFMQQRAFVIAPVITDGGQR